MKKLIFLSLILFLVSSIAIAELYRGGNKEIKIYLCQAVPKEYTDEYTAINIGLESLVKYDSEISVTVEQQDRERKYIDSKTVNITVPAKAKRDFSITMVNWNQRRHLECFRGPPKEEEK